MRYYGADVLNLLKDIASDNLNDALDLIRTARADSGLLDVIKFSTGVIERQYPECLIKLQDSTNVSTELNLDIDNTSEEYPAEILVLMKDLTDKIDLRVEYYIEALQKIFHGYSDSNVSWIEFVTGIRADVYNSDQRETLKAAGIAVKVRIY